MHRGGQYRKKFAQVDKLPSSSDVAKEKPAIRKARSAPKRTLSGKTAPGTHTSRSFKDDTKARVASLESSLEECEAQRTGMRAQLDDKQKQIAVLEERVRERDRKIEDLLSSIDNVQDSSEDSVLRERYNETRAQLKKKSDEAAHSKERVATLEREVERLQNALAESEAGYQQDIRALKSLDGSQLAVEVMELKAKLAECAALRKKAERDASRSQEQLVHTKARLRDALAASQTADFEQLHSKSTRSSSPEESDVLAKLRREAAEYRAKISVVSHSLSEAESTISSLRRANNTANERIAQLMQRNTALGPSSQYSAQYVQQLQERVEKQGDELLRLSRLLEEARSPGAASGNAARSEFPSSAQVRLDELERELEVVTSRCEGAIEALRREGNMRETLMRKLADVENERDDALYEMDRMTGRLRAEEADIKRVSQRLHDETRAHSQSSTALQREVQELKQMLEARAREAAREAARADAAERRAEREVDAARQWGQTAFRRFRELERASRGVVREMKVQDTDVKALRQRVDRLLYEQSGVAQVSLESKDRQIDTIRAQVAHAMATADRYVAKFEAVQSELDAVRAENARLRDQMLSVQR